MENTGLFVLLNLLLLAEAKRPPCHTSYPPETPPPATFEPLTSTVSSPPCFGDHEKWMELGCENTCDDVPLIHCANDTSSSDCEPGCYCFSDDFWRPFVRNANGSCVPYYDCNKPHYQCCPPCGDNERCDIGIYECPRAPCPFPYARCVPA